MREKFLQLKTWVVEGVLWAERELKDKTGPEKKKAVANMLTARLVNMVTLPWYANWAKGIVAPMLINYLIDLACEKLNFLGERNFTNASLNDVQIAEVASVLAAPKSVMALAGAKSADLNERIEELYRQYGITPDAPDAPKTQAIALPATDNNDNLLSKNLTRNEVACRCGCGFDIAAPELVETFQAVRDYIGQPIRIMSGCRCPEHNSKVGGVKDSAHIMGQALDMHISGLAPRTFGEMVRQAHQNGLLPHLRYCYFMPGAVHIGTDEKRRNSLWGW